MSTPEITNAAREAAEAQCCDVCGYPISPTEGEYDTCKCLGIWPYAMSNYPGERRLVQSHPSNTDRQQYYKREEVVALLSTQAARIAELEKALKPFVQVPDDMRCIERVIIEVTGDDMLTAQWALRQASPPSPSAVPDERECRMLEPDKDVLQEGDENETYPNSNIWVPVGDFVLGQVVHVEGFRRRQPEGKQ